MPKMLQNAKKCRKILQNSAECRKIPQNGTKYCKMPQNAAVCKTIQFYGILRNFMEFCGIFQYSDTRFARILVSLVILKRFKNQFNVSIVGSFFFARSKCLVPFCHIKEGVFTNLLIEGV